MYEITFSWHHWSLKSLQAILWNHITFYCQANSKQETNLVYYQLENDNGKVIAICETNLEMLRFQT